MNAVRYLVFGLACAVALAGSGRAETLADALVGAYNHSGLLEQNRATLRAADEDVAATIALLRPVVNWQASASRSLGDSNSTGFERQLESSSISAQITASWQLYDFGADRAQRSAAQETVLATRAGLLSVEQQVLLRAVRAFMNVRAASETVSIRRNNIRLLQEELRAARDRFDVGEVTRTDVALAEAALASARSALALAEGQLQTQREEYRNAVGRYPGVLRRPPALPTLERDVETAKAFAERNHPDLIAAQHQVAASEHLITAAEKAILPTINLEGAVRLDEGIGSTDLSTESATIGVTASGPIYQGGRLASAVRRAMATRDATRSALHVTRHNIAAAVGNAYSDAQVALAQLTASERQIRAAQVAFDGIREEATLGARTTLDVLDAEQQLLDARAARVSAEAGQYIAAYTALASMGLLTAQNLALPVRIYDPEAYYNLVKDGATKRSRQGQQLDRVLKALNK